MEDKKTQRMKELVRILSEAAKAYYQESREIMPNYDYDRLYDELSALEQETGTVLSGSPTQRVGYEVLSELPKEDHERPMLSLDKTKSVEALQEWLGDQKAVLSWKMDGLTVVLTYRDGELQKAVTRGNGQTGEVITNNARVFRNVPLRIPFKGELLLRGEALISYSDFERINASIPETDAKYKNPRNLCSGSVRQLDPRITAERGVFFSAFSLVRAEDPGNSPDFHNSRSAQFDWLVSQGFDVVEHVTVTAETLPEEVRRFEAKIPDNDYPSDGLVLLMEDIAYGESLGATSKFPRNAIAFKWTDETRETTLEEIEWSPSRTGLINPVAIFSPVELEGTTVSRASVHNLSIVKALKLGVGDRILVYKANMIIPQIAENLTRSGTAEPPAVCPVCGTPTEIRQENDVLTLHCPNPECVIKKIKRFGLMTSRDALNVEGLSEATLEKLIAAGFIHEYADLFDLEQYRSQIAEMEGFGEKSADNLLKAVESARNTDMTRFVYSLGIPGIGLQNAKMLNRHFRGSFEAFRNASAEELCEIEGIGEVLARAVREYLEDPENIRLTEDLLQKLHLEPPAAEGGEDSQASLFAGKTFVITGSVTHFKNREELKRFIEDRGGKAAGSVSAKTSYLINNDKTSSSSKNKKAKELGVPVISEEDFLKLCE
ncbi:MAG: NAD-dependent DNA ligase LigA [Stomatobaculum sp.]|nr:NAD-dependent DNA ligase LigA [Stomatobaculum sp.]